jgi:hypothetical protein
MDGAGKSQKPRIVDKPSQTVAVVTSKGDPNVVGERVFKALFGSVYTLKMSMKKSGSGDFKVTGLRARWPDAHIAPKDEWTAHWAIPIPEGTMELPQKNPPPEVRVEIWSYGSVGEVLHIGPYSEEGPSVQSLHEFIERSRSN